MIQKIYKYELEVTDEQIIYMPQNRQILSVSVQNGKICVWAIVDILRVLKPTTFHIYGTGNTMPEIDWNMEDRIFYGTVQLNGFVWHIFENYKWEDD